MSEIYSAIGFNIICLAITLIVVGICAYDLETKDKIKMIIGEVVFMALLTVGVMFMAYNKQ